ncbi:MAG: helix-turn-helix domain-containing protein [Prevotellaceae bacterium]|jgi:transcriptional regulator with XRE-family HTH domain|nr:helix-turn-helix domain-containing protein [Prevotellaceae bacterium]
MRDLDIIKIRKNLGVSQKKLAEMLCVHERTIQNWENGGTIPNVKHAILRAIASGKNITGEGEMLKQDAKQEDAKSPKPAKHASLDIDALIRAVEINADTNKHNAESLKTLVETNAKISSELVALAKEIARLKKVPLAEKRRRVAN